VIKLFLKNKKILWRQQRKKVKETGIEKKNKPTDNKEKEKETDVENKKSKDNKKSKKSTDNKKSIKKLKNTELKSSIREKIIKDKIEKNEKEIKKINSIDYFEKYGYDIYNEDDKRKESLGQLVIIYGISDLLRKLDGVSSKNPNFINKINSDKKWLKNAFKI
jgi:predicted  nucleic acid-binding Zn-ribbon protein